MKVKVQSQSHPCFPVRVVGLSKSLSEVSAVCTGGTPLAAVKDAFT